MQNWHKRARGRPLALLVIGTLLLAGLVGVPPSPAAAAGSGNTWTLDADFDQGLMVGVSHDAPNNDQLQLNASSSTFPFIWVANSSEGTISKLDTTTGQELGRYRTAPDSAPKNPSRTTVDQDGNVWVGNRNSNTVTKVGLLEAGNCIDRNLNGTIETSTGKFDVKSWPAGGPNDECILLHVTLPKSANIRMVAVDPNNDIYAGGSSNGWFYHIDGETGALLLDRNNPRGINYGGVVDPEGNLWIATLWQNRLVKYDPAADAFQVIALPHTSYGLGIDKFGNIWHSGYNYRTISKIRRSDGAILGTYPIPGGCDSRGVAVEDNGDVWVANTCSDRAGHLGNDGSPKGSVVVGNGPTGVAIDAAGKVWVTNLYSNNATRIDPADDTTSTFAVGSGPYNYSDMTGHVVRNITTNQGTWTVVHDSGATGTAWGTVSWNGSTPANTAITARVRAADSVAGLGSNTYVGVGNNIGFSGVTGRYIQIEVKLETTQNGLSPILHDVTVTPETPCDPNPRLTWKTPLSAGTVYNMPAGSMLPIRFSYGTCAGFIHDESVIIMIQDPANPTYPVTAWVYGWDIAIDDVAEEYQQDFDSSWYWLSPGTDLQVLVFFGDQFVGEAPIKIVP